MLNIFVCLIVFVIGYLFLTRRISQIADSISQDPENQRSQMNGSIGLDNAIGMFLAWIFAFCVFLIFVATTHLNKPPNLFDLLDFMVHLHVQMILYGFIYLAGLL